MLLFTFLLGSWDTTLQAQVIAWGYNGKGETDVPADLTNVVAVAGGNFHSLALKADGKVVAWGDNASGQTNVPADLRSVVAISAGEEHNLALLADGTVTAWGRNDCSQTNVPAGLSNVLAIAGGSRHSLALKMDGTIVAWGWNANGQATVPTGLSNVVAITAGGRHSLALRADGTVVAWGYNAAGQTSVPAGLSHVIAIAAGGSHNLALKDDGTIVAWGDNGYGQTNVPGSLTNVLAIAGGGGHCLVLQADGTVVAWGANYSGQADVPTGLTKVVAIAAGGSHCLTLAGNVVPVITSQMAHRSVVARYDVNFWVNASGSQPLSFQWQYRGTSLLGFTNAILALTNVQMDQAGSYSVIVSNALGCTTSTPALLGVEPLRILEQPKSQEVSFGGSVTFGVVVLSSFPIGYQWFFNGAAIPEATNQMLTLSNATMESFGAYSVIATNGLGMVTSLPTALPMLNVRAWGNNTNGQCNVPSGLTDVIAIAGGVSNSLALKADGTVRAWGANNYGQTNVPAGLTNAIAIAGGGYHGLVLKDNGTVVAWGWNAYGQTNVPAGLSNVIAIAAGERHSLALREDGTVIAWGGNSYGQTNVPVSLSNVTAIAAGSFHNLALKANGTVTAWGWSSYGQTSVPTSLTNAVAVAGGSRHSLALRSDGTVVGWGYNTFGQRTVPAGLSNVVGIAAGGDHSLALKEDGTVIAWGNNADGQTNVPVSLTGVSAIAAGGAHNLALAGYGPPKISLQMLNQRVAAGLDAFLSGTAIGAKPLSYQWQFNGTNLLGFTNALLILTNVQFGHAGLYSVLVSNAFGCITSTPSRLIVEAILLDEQPQTQEVSYGAGVTFKAGILGVQPLACQWRFNDLDLPGATNQTLTIPEARMENVGRYSVIVSNAYGMVTSQPAVLWVRNVLAWGDYNAGLTPVPKGLTNVIAISAGTGFNLVQKADGTIVAWGANGSGQTNVPARLTNVVAIAAGGGHSLALKPDGTVVGWGLNSSRQTNVPPGLSNVVALSAGYRHSLALQADGKVVAWGDNAYGQTNVPPGLSNVVAIAAGNYHNLALQADGLVVAWGSNEYGKTNVPAGLSNVVGIAGGGYHSLAVTADGKVVAWGFNGYGQTSVPVDLTGATAVAAGLSHSLALTADGLVVAWGRNYDGQTNVPSALTDAVAVEGGESHSLAMAGYGPPAFTSQMPHRSTAVGLDVFFSFTASGGRPLSYQWQFNGSNLPGFTNASLALTNVQFAQDGVYAVAVSNAFGCVTSAPSRLMVEPTQVFLQPATQEVNYGATTTFKVLPKGLPPFTYQWRHNGMDLPGATNQTLSLGEVNMENAGMYSVVASNAYGTVNSLSSALFIRNVMAWGWDLSGCTNLPLGLTNAISLGAGKLHSMALKADGTVAVWGDNYYGQTNLPVELTNVIAIAAGGDHNLVLRTDGTLVAWGDNSYGQTNIPAGLTNVIAIAAGFDHNLALKTDGKVVAWGCDKYGQTNVPVDLENVVAIAGGSGYSLALKSCGTVVAWGDNSYGQTNVPSSLTDAIAIAGGRCASLAIRQDETVVAWEGNIPKSVINGWTNVMAICVGENHYQTLKMDGTVVAWGSNSHGQTNVPGNLSNVVAVAAGYNHSLALIGNGPPVITSPVVSRSVISESNVCFRIDATGRRPLSYQWQFNGLNLFGCTNGLLIVTNAQAEQSGAYTVVVSNAVGCSTSAPGFLCVEAARMVAQPRTQEVVYGATVMFEFTVQGVEPFAFRWQYNGLEMHGCTNATLELTNIQFSQAGSYSVTVSNIHGCITSAPAHLIVNALSVDAQPESRDSLYGGDVFFEVSVNSTLPLSYQWEHDGTGVPWATNRVLVVSNVKPEDAGTYAVVASNKYGRVVSRSSTLRVRYLASTSSVLVGPPNVSNVVAIAVGENYSMALKSDGNVIAWYENGDVATDFTADMTNIVALASGLYQTLALRIDGTLTAWGGSSAGLVGLNDVVAIAVGGHHSLAVKANGSVVGIGGYNLDGQLDVPPDLNNAVAVSAGVDYSVALKADGKVVAWGDNSYGQINVPLGLSNVVAIAAGGYHCLALKSDGNITSWGSNNENQRNVPYCATNIVAIAAGYMHSMALRADGMLFEFGNNNTDPESMQKRIKNIVAIAPGILGGGLVLVGPAARFAVNQEGIKIKNGLLSLKWDTIPGRTYQVQYCDELGSGSWFSLGTSNKSFGRSLTVTNQVISPRRFFRVMQTD